MNELRIHVERAVRPVMAAAGKKLLMRHELYAHLMEIFSEELERCDDRASAVAAAKQRFGEPSNLSRELQRTVSWIQRGEGIIDYWILPRPAETTLRHAYRVTTYFLISCPLLISLAAAVWLTTVFLGQSDKSFSNLIHDLMHVGIPLLLFAAAGIFIFMVLGYRMCAEFERTTTRSGVLRVVALMVCSMVVVLLGGWALHFVLTGDYHQAMKLLTTRWIILAFLMPAFLTLTARLICREREQAEPWIGLNLEE